MTFPLEVLAPSVTARVETWARLEMRWCTRPIQPNYGKPVVSVEFESSAWLADVTIWVTGEAKLATVRLVDERIVNKHNELVCNGDLEVSLACDAAWSGVGRRAARLRQRCRATTPGIPCIADVSKIAYAAATAVRLQWGA